MPIFSIELARGGRSRLRESKGAGDRGCMIRSSRAREPVFRCFDILLVHDAPLVLFSHKIRGATRRSHRIRAYEAMEMAL